MAAPGEADERWIVKDHGENGRNVNSWHWEEKQRMPWCKERLSTLLLVASGGGGGGSGGASITRIQSVEGEATTTTRKGGKRFAVYDLRVTCAWSVGGDGAEGGEAVGDGKAAGGGDDAEEEAHGAAAEDGGTATATATATAPKQQKKHRTGTVVIEELASTHEPDDYVLTFKADGSSAEDAAARDDAERRLKGPLLGALARFCAEIAEL
jgi:hypothetical protein